jgi:DNA (cytosine-5)-methyltransferase 1
MDLLPKYKTKKVITVGEAIGDLSACMPINGKKASHTTPTTAITWHTPRYHSERDKGIFKLLAEDIETQSYQYLDSKVLSDLYEEKVGSHSPIHRYHVLRADEPSTTIIAHLYKDGNRYIHYDSKQERTITPREAARLQSFPDDFDFVGNRGNVYQMIGNAVPPTLAKNVAFAVSDLYSIITED